MVAQAKSKAPESRGLTDGHETFRTTVNAAAPVVIGGTVGALTGSPGLGKVAGAITAGVVAKKPNALPEAMAGTALVSGMMILAHIVVPFYLGKCLLDEIFGTSAPTTTI